MSRWLLAIPLVFVLTAAIALSPATGAGPGSGMVLAPPSDGRIYHSAYPNFRGSEDHVRTAYVKHFQKLARKRIAWTYFSDNWIDGISFPNRAVGRIHAAGSVPFIRLMARSDFDEGHADRRYTLQRIIDGDFDDDLTAWGEEAAAVPYPMLVEFGTEVNGFWFPWNGKWNGAGQTEGYGDPGLADGPERFIDAYRHIHDVLDAAGADNLTWFYHVDAGGWPNRPWNTIASYYPGSAYVDWLGISAYGPLTPDDPWGKGFAHKLDRAYPKLHALAPEKPIAVLEYGARQGHRKAGWIRNAIRAVARHRWPSVRALSYWHEGWINSDGTKSKLCIDSDHRSLHAYRRGIHRHVFTGRAVFEER